MKAFELNENKMKSVTTAQAEKYGLAICCDVTVQGVRYRNEPGMCDQVREMIEQIRENGHDIEQINVGYTDMAGNDLPAEAVIWYQQQWVEGGDNSENYTGEQLRIECKHMLKVILLAHFADMPLSEIYNH